MAQIETVDIDGIEVPFDRSALTSSRFGMAIGDLSDDDLSDDEKLVVNARLMRMLFGDSRYKVMGMFEREGVELAEWLPRFFEAVGAKN